jgi:hypothetical protein
MESRFGTNFDDVRVHADQEAAESAALLRADAYTAGRVKAQGSHLKIQGLDNGRSLIAAAEISRVLRDYLPGGEARGLN